MGIPTACTSGPGSIPGDACLALYNLCFLELGAAAAGKLGCPSQVGL